MEIKWELTLLLLFAIKGISGWWGQIYWSQRYGRYGINYGNWRGFWNDESSYPGYKRDSESKTITSGCIVDEAAKTLDCSKSTRLEIDVRKQYTFTYIPENAFDSRVEEIQISNEELKTIHPKAFHNLVNLEKLKIVSTKLNHIPDVSRCSKLKNLDLFDNAIEVYRHNVTNLPSSLEEVILISNKIYKFPVRYFNLPKLRYMGLALNVMEHFPGDAFGNVQALEYLGVDDNKIDSISRRELEPLMNSPSFRHLNISNNRINYIAPKALKVLKNLVVLELHNNLIVNLPKYALWRIPKLVHIDIDHNKIAVLKSNFITDCPELRNLYLHSQVDKMRSVYFDSLHNLTKLTQVYLGSNALAQFPHPVFSEEVFPSLSSLYLDNNQIPSLSDYSKDEFPPSAQVHYLTKKDTFKPFKNLPVLTTLDVKSNSIMEIKKTDLEYARSLQVLFIQGNLLPEGSIHEDAFVNTTSLVTLDLSSQRGTPRIQYIPKALQKHTMPNLGTLLLYGNKITFILKGAFIKIPKLEYLSLSANQIVAIDDDAFPNSLSTLLLSSNKFAFTNYKPFFGLTKLESLNLQGNKIKVIPDVGLHGLERIKNLKLSANKIGRLKKIHFKDIKIMTELDFDSNDIAFIEDGTFAENRPSNIINYMLFRVNRVTRLPKTDFWNMHINILSFRFNRITKLHKGDFNNTEVYDKVVLFQNRIERIESYAVVNLNAVNFQIGGQQGNNPLQIIQQYAFVDVRVGNELDLSYHSVTTLESYSFNIKGIQGTLYVNNGQLKAIETFAFNLGRTNGVIDLSKNKIETIARKIFVDGTTFRDLNLYGNKLRSIDDYAFLGSSMTGLLAFYQNELTIFPASAIKIYTSMKHLKMSSNRIEAIPAGSLDTLTNLQIFEMWQTDLKKIPNNLFINNAKLQTIKLEDNKITTLEDDYLKMNGNSDLRELRIDQNPITHVPKFNQSYPRLEKFWAKNVQTVSPELFGSNMPALRYFSLDTTRLECECFWYDTILGYLSRSNEYVEKTIQCQSPPPLRGFNEFRDANAIRGRKHQFICIPSNIVVSAPADYTIQLNYDYPTRLYPEENVNLATDKLYFDATCKLENKDVFLTASVLNQKQITITGNDRVLAGRNYWCHMTMTYNRNSQGNVTSAQSQSILITTLERKSKATSCSRGDAYECQTLESHITCVTNAGCDIDASNALRKSSCDQSGCCLHCFKSCIKCNNTVVDTQTIDITYYDFSRDDPDFAKSRYTPDIARPKFMASPYETWLSNPAIEDPLLDSFSGWFQSITGRNKVVKSTITLSSEGKSDTVNNKDLFTFWDNDFWAVNGRGFTAEGQKDCNGLELINFGFTSAIRSGFIFGGGEHMQFAGGEDLWVYINKQLVMSIVIPQGYDGKQVICKTLHLQNTTTSGLLIPHVGIVDQNTRTCINTRPLMEEAVTINLKENIMYSLDIFHVERFRCTSEFLLATSGIVFAGTERQKDIVDYIFEPPEDLHLKAIIGEFLVSDLYNSNSPYTVTVETGNSEDRYDIVRNSMQAHHDSATKPEATIYKNFTLNGEIIIVCPNNTNASANNNFEHTITSPQAFPNIDTKYALLLLKQPLDYETTSRYQLNLKVEDHGGRLGYITILILVVDKSDNCPIIRDKVFPHFTPLPPLQQNPLLTIAATDADSGLNGKISYVSQLISKIPTLKHTPFDNDGKTVWENKTVEWTIHVNLYAIDNGSPKRGDFFSISMSYAPSCDKTGRIVVNETSGEVFFAAPGMTTNDTSKFRYGEDQCYECTAGYFCPGNGQELNCVQNEETKHYFSYGFASSCSPCPEGWLCHNGILRKCAENTYVKCNTTWCPQSCFECQPGYYCYEGIRQSCRPGTFSKGKGPCQLCAPGSFSNSSNSIQCTCCPSGYGSTYEKTSCEPCQFKEFSTGECTMCKTCVPPGSCGCDRNPCYRSVSCFNTGESGASFQCGNCPNGYSGDGTSCQDVDECTNNNVCYNSACINMSPGFKCAGCPPGFTGNAPHGVGGEVVHERQFCRDINECENPELHSCDPNAECINTLGSYRCGKCKPGYVGDGYLGCKSGDYCATGQHNCHINATCIPLGSRKFTCVCKEGYAGNGQICGLDHDYDGVTSFGAACIENSCKLDRCAYVPNSGQEDNDQDTLGDVCDNDDDDDNIPDKEDNCPFNRSRRAGTDSDSDGVQDTCDNCVSVKNGEQTDMDGDGVGDACDQDADNDGVTTTSDNCKFHVNTDQKDTDGDGVGDVCDNCPKHSNGNQLDDDESGFGNVCEGTGKDSDGDGIPNDYDNCPHIANAEQTDTDQDGTGDVCDNDKDGDNIADVDDNCVYVPNPDQRHTINYDMDARPVGLACVDDYDGDKVPDADDHCPFNSNLHMLTFKENQQVDLAKDDVSQADQPKARWRVNSNGRDLEQLQATNRPSVLLGKQSYSDVEYSGVLHVNTDVGDDYAGVVFGYQNNKRFYVMMWRNENKNYGNTSYLAGTRGIQIKRVNSNSGELGSALWFSSDTWNKVDLLWQDPRMVGWKHRESYIFKIQFQASLSRMRFKLQKGEEVISDSGYIHDELITGGRLGVYTHGQGDVIFSRLTAKCMTRSNMALSLNGNDSYVILPDLQQLQIEFSLMVKFWIKLPANYERTKQPIVCTRGSSLCIYLNDRKMTVDLSGKTVVGGEVAGDSWQHFTIRYDGQGDCKLPTECNPEKQLTIFQNNIKTKTETIGSVAYNYKEELYIGTDKQNYMKGLIDELSFWWVTEEDSRVTAATKMAALSWPLHQHLVTAYYNMNQLSDANNTLQDQSEFSNHAKYFKTKFVESTSDYDRFRLTYPSR